MYGGYSLRRLELKDFEQLYALIEKSFPEDEYRIKEEQEALFFRKEYKAYGLVDENSQEIQAFISLWQFEAFAFIEHFAVNPACRNGGMGSSVLQEVLKKQEGMVCLEVELPENELAARRIRFYRRNGFYLNEFPYIQPPISKGRNSIPLRIMTWDKPVSADRFQAIKSTLYQKVYGVQ